MTERTYTIVEIAAALGKSKRTTEIQAAKAGWSYQEQSVRGGKQRFYAKKSLPPDVRAALEKKAFDQVFAEIKAAPAAAFTAKASIAVIPRADGAIALRGLTRKAHKESDLTDLSRARRDGALILCRAIDAGIARAHRPARAAIVELAGNIVGGSACPELIAAAAVTYAKPRQSGQTAASLTSRLQKMYAAYEQGRKAGDCGLYLVSGQREKTGQSPADIRAFLIHYCRPTRPPITEAWRQAESWYAANGLHYPAKDTFYRIEKSLPVTIKYRGRVTGSEWRGLKPYVDRDVSMFHSNDIWVGDGHSFKAKVQHPVHGQPFVPEVTLIIDWVSRKVVGWSVDLAESTIAVSAAFRHAQLTTRARPLIYYSDNGAGQTGKMIDCPIAGTLARQGIAHETGIPGNPQGRGIIERLWQVTLIPLARTYPTCTWRGADENATTRMLKLLNKKDQGGVSIPQFGQFLIDVDACIKKYNLEHEHRELKGNTPEDEYQARLDRDSIVFGPSDTEIMALWMPEVIRTPQRGVISLFGNEYGKRDLVDILPEGGKVRVRYDLHNAGKVWLLTLDGRYLGEAVWESHKVAAFPVPEMDRHRANRAKGKVKRGEKIIAEAQAELGNTYDMEPATPMPIRVADMLPVAVEEIEEEAMMSHGDFILQFYGKGADEEDGEEDFKSAAV